MRLIVDAKPNFKATLKDEGEFERKIDFLSKSYLRFHLISKNQSFYEPNQEGLLSIPQLKYSDFKEEFLNPNHSYIFSSPKNKKSIIYSKGFELLELDVNALFLYLDLPELLNFDNLNHCSLLMRNSTNSGRIMSIEQAKQQYKAWDLYASSQWLDF